MQDSESAQKKKNIETSLLSTFGPKTTIVGIVTGPLIKRTNTFALIKKTHCKRNNNKNKSPT
jgi:hypothetical protein